MLIVKKQICLVGNTSDRQICFFYQKTVIFSPKLRTFRAKRNSLPKLRTFRAKRNFLPQIADFQNKIDQVIFPDLSHMMYHRMEGRMAD